MNADDFSKTEETSKEKDVEMLVSECRQKIRDAGKSGNAVLARAYATNLSVLLGMRSASCVMAEEKEKGLI